MNQQNEPTKCLNWFICLSMRLNRFNRAIVRLILIATLFPGILWLVVELANWARRQLAVFNKWKSKETPLILRWARRGIMKSTNKAPCQWNTRKVCVVNCRGCTTIEPHFTRAPWNLALSFAVMRMGTDNLIWSDYSLRIILNHSDSF